jgi:hypothetical protein
MESRRQTQNARVSALPWSDLLLTTDKNLAFQRRLEDRKIAIVVLGNPQWPVARLHIESIMTALNSAIPGSYKVVEMSADPDRK